MEERLDIAHMMGIFCKKFESIVFPNGLVSQVYQDEGLCGKGFFDYFRHHILEN